MKVNKLVLQLEDGTHIMDLDLVVPIEKDLTTNEMIRLINPILSEKGYQITEMSKKGILEYRIWLMKGRKHEVYKICQKLRMEDEIEIDLTKESMKVEKAKKDIPNMSFDELISEIEKINKNILNKENFTPKDMTEFNKLQIFETERDKRLKIVSEAMEKIKVDKSVKEFMLNAMKSLRGL